MTVSQAFQIALQHHQAGRLPEAEALYHQILAAQPNHAEALHFLGVIAHQSGRNQLAVEWIRKAVALDPNNPIAYSNLGVACRALGRVAEAIAAYRRALELKPDYPEAHINLGNALSDQGQFTEAAAACRRALELKPDYPEAHNNLGNALRELGQFDEALAEYRRAIELKANYPEAHNNLANAFREQGQLAKSVAACRRAIELKSDLPEAHNNLGNALRELGQLDEAVIAFHRALELNPKFPEAYNNLGNALRDQGDLDGSIAALRRALQWKPDYPSAHSNLIYTLHLHPNYDHRTILEEQQRWNRQFSDPQKQFIQAHGDERDPDRRLRIGYVSPDFRDHAVGRYALPLLEQHDRERFEIFCYSGVRRPDWLTERFRALAGGWRDTAGVSNGQLAELIRKDGVDILVDLALHTADNRLPMFARKPAPVQVTWLGYAGSSGVDGIGYRFTDAHMEPFQSRQQEESQGGAASCRLRNDVAAATPQSDENPAYSAEKPVRLPDCWCCYDPIGDSPEINPLPALSAAGVTFGSLNNFTKVNEGVLALWARVLEAIKESRVIMLCPKGRTRERVLAFFGARGIAAERVEWAAIQPRLEYLKLYQRIDLALDPFPYNGMTTTCDALWMGVPVLTSPGTMPASRAGLSLLSSVGLGEFAAPSEEDYIRLAVELANNLPRLANLRTTLRPRMQASPLMDAPRFARNIEAAYRSMWQRACTTP